MPAWCLIAFSEVFRAIDSVTSFLNSNFMQMFVVLAFGGSSLPLFFFICQGHRYSVNKVWSLSLEFTQTFRKVFFSLLGMTVKESTQSFEVLLIEGLIWDSYLVRDSDDSW